MLELKNISKVFYAGTVNEKTALDHLDLKLEDGDFVTVIGGNGAGKSTTIECILGTKKTACGEKRRGIPHGARTFGAKGIGSYAAERIDGRKGANFPFRRGER